MPLAAIHRCFSAPEVDTCHLQLQWHEKEAVNETESVGWVQVVTEIDSGFGWFENVTPQMELNPSSISLEMLSNRENAAWDMLCKQVLAIYERKTLW
eukprot:1154199-Pelagomonas_calceolata.AAC.9